MSQPPPFCAPWAAVKLSVWCLPSTLSMHSLSQNATRLLTDRWGLKQWGGGDSNKQWKIAWVCLHVCVWQFSCSLCSHCHLIFPNSVYEFRWLACGPGSIDCEELTNQADRQLSWEHTLAFNSAVHKAHACVESWEERGKCYSLCTLTPSRHPL